MTSRHGSTQDFRDLELLGSSASELWTPSGLSPGSPGVLFGNLLETPWGPCPGDKGQIHPKLCHPINVTRHGPPTDGHASNTWTPKKHRKSLGINHEIAKPTPKSLTGDFLMEVPGSRARDRQKNGPRHPRWHPQNPVCPQDAPPPKKKKETPKIRPR